ncbi:unannotated protein [freshwater metagenome]|uniref:Unannotated protein n=1 Tax=freshwater metagenome TaxID=449393 RepID=A0A6J7Q474_9ZZZZ
MSPPVAKTESPKAHDTASAGDTTTITRTAVARTAGPDRRPPVRRARSMTTPITAARTTLGWGRTRMTK